MQCRVIRTADGRGIGFACGPRSRRQCSVPECRRPAVALCDFPLAGGKTCDAALCEGHARHVGPDRDLCHPHAWWEAAHGRALPAAPPAPGGPQLALPAPPEPPPPRPSTCELMRLARERRRA